MNTEEPRGINDLEQKLWNVVEKLSSTLETAKYKYNRGQDEHGEEYTLKISLVGGMLDQTFEQDGQALIKSWFVDFEPTRAKVAAKKRWLAIHDIVETSSPTCYAGEFTSSTAMTKKRTLNEAMTQAAIASIIGEPVEKLAHLNTEQLEQLKATADLFPDALVESELGEMPVGWGEQTVQDVIELLITSISK